MLLQNRSQDATSYVSQMDELCVLSKVKQGKIERHYNPQREELRPVEQAESVPRYREKTACLSPYIPRLSLTERAPMICDLLRLRRTVDATA
jgi:hypothetical protein